MDLVTDYPDKRGTIRTSLFYLHLKGFPQKISQIIMSLRIGLIAQLNYEANLQAFEYLVLCKELILANKRTPRSYIL